MVDSTSSTSRQTRWRSGWPRRSSPTKPRLRRSLACLLLLPSRAGGLRLPTSWSSPKCGQFFAATCVRRASRQASGLGMRSSASQMKAVGTGAVDGVPAPASRPSVAVIGAGAAGLAAGRILRDEGLRVTIFEKSSYLGGAWRYRPEPEACAPMYRSLVTNLPKETMSYMGFPFPAELPSFTTHRQVLDYLCAYADQHDLHPLITFDCAVESVRPLPFEAAPPAGIGNYNGNSDSDDVPPEAATTAATTLENVGDLVESGEGEGEKRRPKGTLGKWEVVYHQTGVSGELGEAGEGANERLSTAAAAAQRGTKDRVAFDVGATTSTTSKKVTEIFDAVCVCNGHYDEAFIPEAEGFDGFRGTSMHSRAYDRPDVEAFEGRRVLCVGSRSSGTDIAREVSFVASVVHVCDKATSTSLNGGERGNIWWRPAIERFDEANGVRFKDGTQAEVDTVVWCTGYSYSFPFLDGSGLLTPPVKKRVHPLYEQLFHVRYPSLTFVGLPQSVVPFPLFEVQANAVAAAISGRCSLPSLAERRRWLLDDERRGLQERGVDPTSRGVHVFRNRQWTYSKRLLQLAGGPGVVMRAPQPRCGVDGGSGSASSGPKSVLGDCAASPPSAQKEDDEEGDETALLSTLDMKEAVYKDASNSRPPFPGGPDDYRRRMYSIDRESGRFSVYWAERKANGEGSSAAAAAAAALSSEVVVNGTPKA